MIYEKNNRDKVGELIELIKRKIYEDEMLGILLKNEKIMKRLNEVKWDFLIKNFEQIYGKNSKESVKKFFNLLDNPKELFKKLLKFDAVEKMKNFKKENPTFKYIIDEILENEDLEKENSKNKENKNHNEQIKDIISKIDDIISKFQKEKKNDENCLKNINRMLEELQPNPKNEFFDRVPNDFIRKYLISLSSKIKKEKIEEERKKKINSINSKYKTNKEKTLENTYKNVMRSYKKSKIEEDYKKKKKQIENSGIDGKKYLFELQLNPLYEQLEEYRKVFQGNVLEEPELFISFSKSKLDQSRAENLAKIESLIKMTIEYNELKDGLEREKTINSPTEEQVNNINDEVKNQIILISLNDKER